MTLSPALLLLADGRFPTGGHAHSAGVEAAAAIGDVHDLATLERYLRGRLATTGVVDAAFAAAGCWSIAGEGVDVDAAVARCTVLDRELEARILSRRARDVSRRLGRQLLRVARSTWPSPVLDRLADGFGADGFGVGGGAVHQPIATGAVVAVAGGTADDAARLAMHHLGAAVTGAAVRLLGLDPMAAAGLQVRTAPLVDRLVVRATDGIASAPSELPADGGALTEILAEHHGTWPARLFVG